jgi:hypothetical protein
MIYSDYSKNNLYNVACSIEDALVGVWASLNFHEFLSNSQPLGFNRVTSVTPPPLYGRPKITSLKINL